MISVYIISFLIIGMITLFYHLDNQSKVAKFRDTLVVGQEVFVLYRDINKYYCATIKKINNKRDLGYTMVLLEVFKEESNEIVWTSVLNIYPYNI